MNDVFGDGAMPKSTTERTRSNGAIPDADVRKAPRVPTSELGTTGLHHSGGFINEERLAPLRWPQAASIYRQMAENDAVIGAVLYGIDMLIRNVEWRVEPFEAGNAEDEKNATFMRENMEDMSHSWAEFVSEALSMLPYGFSPHEIVYKRRNGDNRSPGLRSRFSDGRIGWRKLPIRAQDTVEGWVFDDEGGIQAMTQLDPNRLESVVIPIERLVLFRPRAWKNNPQGQSILRTAWRAWMIKKTIEEYEAIRIERDATGVPIAWVPAEITRADASAEDQALYDEIKKVVRNLKFNEQAGVVFPLVYDDQNNPLYKLELLQLDNRTMIDTMKVVERWDSRIAMTALADFILIGHTSQTGSYSLVSSRTNLFSFALGAYLISIADVLNRHAVPRLFRLNGLPSDRLPKLIPGDIEGVDLSELGTYIQQMAGAGAPLFPNRDLEEALLEMAGLPAPPKDDGDLGRVTPIEPNEGDMVSVAPGKARLLGRAETDAIDSTAGSGHLAAVDPETGWTWHVGGDIRRAGSAVERMSKRFRAPRLILARHVGVHEDGTDVYQAIRP